MIALAPLIATRLLPDIAHRTWPVTATERSHLFLLCHGRALFSRADSPTVEVAAPALLWLPPATSAGWQVLAGGDGFTASVAGSLMQRIVGDIAPAAALRPLLDRTALLGPDTLTIEIAKLAGSFAALVEEARALRPGAAAVIGMHLGLILVQLWRCAGPPGDGAAPAAGAGTAQRFRQLVELHYRDGLRIDAFAARLGVSRAHLHDACLRATGRTPLALLHDRLLAEARARLEQTDLSVEQVGYGIGFRDPGYFSRFFKRLTGASPGAHRRRAAAAAARTPPAPDSFAAWP